MASPRGRDGTRRRAAHVGFAVDGRDAQRELVIDPAHVEVLDVEADGVGREHLHDVLGAFQGAE